MSSSELIQRCRKKFGSAPRELDAGQCSEFKIRTGFLMGTVFWLTRDKLTVILRDQELLREHGRVVWGALVQANSYLFDPSNRDTFPANAIYDPEQAFDDCVEDLQEIASGIFDLKGTDPDDDELQMFADAITNERQRTMRLSLPKSMTNRRKVYFTSCLIQPSHLPNGYLADSVFPMVVCPEKTDAAMILPSSYWPKTLIEIWDEE